MFGFVRLNGDPSFMVRLTIEPALKRESRGPSMRARSSAVSRRTAWRRASMSRASLGTGLAGVSTSKVGWGCPLAARYSLTLEVLVAIRVASSTISGMLTVMIRLFLCGRRGISVLQSGYDIKLFPAEAPLKTRQHLVFEQVGQVHPWITSNSPQKKGRRNLWTGLESQFSNSTSKRWRRDCGGTRLSAHPAVSSGEIGRGSGRSLII